MRFTTFEDVTGHAGDVCRKLRFEMHDVDLAIVNALRRILLAELPNVAIPFDAFSTNTDGPGVRITENTGVLHNEVIGNRVSLLPVCVSADELHTIAREQCANCPSRYRFQLRVTNSTDAPMDVTTDHMHVFKDGIGCTALRHKFFPSCPISGDPVLITTLRPGERLWVEAVPRVGTGQEHARWCPVSRVAVRPLPSGGHVMTVDSECRLHPATLVSAAWRVLIAKVQALHAKLVDKTVALEADGAAAFRFTIPGETHTLGNVVQAALFDCPTISYIGYFQPHPLKATIVFRVVLAAGTDLAAAVHTHLVEPLMALADCWRHDLPSDLAAQGGVVGDTPVTAVAAGAADTAVTAVTGADTAVTAVTAVSGLSEATVGC
jgi:DNA-directed RNA polymerase subunit L